MKSIEITHFPQTKNEYLKSNSEPDLRNLSGKLLKTQENQIIKSPYSSDSDSANFDMECASRTSDELNSKLQQLLLSHPELSTIKKTPSPKNRKRSTQSKIQSPSYSSLSSDESDSEQTTIVRTNSLSPTSDLDQTKGSLLNESIVRGKSLPPPKDAKKRVSFADCSGKTLRRIRIISENRDDPPSFLANRANRYSNSLNCLQRGSLSSDGSSGFGDSYSSGNSDDDSAFKITTGSCARGFTNKDLSGLANFINRLKDDREISANNTRRCNSMPILMNRQKIKNQFSSLRSGSASTIEEQPISKPKQQPKFQPCFMQPAQNRQLLFDKLNENMVTLERSTINSGNFRGTILVRNICFHKKVFVRYSTDNWQTTHDRPAFWQKSNIDQTCDTFEFNATIFETEKVDKVQFCIKFQAEDRDFWDSNSGQNYAFQQIKLSDSFFR